MYISGKFLWDLPPPVPLKFSGQIWKLKKIVNKSKNISWENPFETSHPCSPVESHFPGQVVQGRDTDSVRSPITEQSSVLRLRSKFTARHLMLLPFICNVNV